MTAEPSAQAPLEVGLSANQQSYDAQLGRIVAIGHAQATLAGGRLLADRIEYDTNTRTVYASGAVRFQRGQQYLQASRLRYSLLEGVGEIEDVYGVLDLDTSSQDFDPNSPPSEPLGPRPEMACTAPIPPLPDWQPHPWAATVWAGQMVDTNFGDTFLFRGTWRPEYLGGIGLQRRLLDGGPFSFELDTNLIGHRAASQAGGPFNQAVPNGNVPAQGFGEITAGIGLRLWVRPWLNLFVVEGVSYNTAASNYEKTFRENYAQLLNYLAFEVEALVNPTLSLVGRIHHRSGAYGTYSGVREGSNGYLLGLRYRFGQRVPASRVAAAMPPALGCPGVTAESLAPRPSLNQQLDAVASGEAAPAAAGSNPAETGAKAAAPPAQRGNAWQRAREQERLREQAVAAIDQRVRNVRFQRSLQVERRFGFPSELTTPDTENDYGNIRPEQLRNLTTAGNRELVKGTVNRWRFQAKRMTVTAGSLRGDRVAFTNDPFTPAQSWLNSEDVVVSLQPNGDTVIEAGRNRLILDERLPIPVTRRTTIRKEDEVENRWVLGQDGEDRDGFFVGYNLPPLRFGQEGTLQLQPQVLVQRAIQGSTDSYPLPGQSAGSSPSEQPISASDVFGLVARLNTPLLGFKADATLDLSTFNPENFANGTRSWGQLARSVDLPLLGDSLLRLFGAYRYRTWNGSLGEQDVYSAYGISLEDTGELPNWGRMSHRYFWRAGVGNYQGNDFESTTLSDLWRGNVIASLTSRLPLWTGQPLNASPLQALAYSPQPVVPGLALRTNLTGQLAYYGDGSNQNTLSFSAGPTLTLGHFSKPFLDYTQFTISGGVTLRQGVSPLSFDRAVDLGTLNVGLTQQIAGPLVFSGGIGYNVDPSSEFYGEVTNSYVELRWQRRSYEIGVYYSPYEQLGGIRIKLNDFDFRGSGTPFVPYHPGEAPLRRPF